MIKCNARIAICAAVAVFGAQAARYIDPLNGSDSNNGSIGAPWKTLAQIHNLEDTVYITNSAVCYFGSSGDRSPSNVLLTSWGLTRPTITISNFAVSWARGIYLSSSNRTIRMKNLKWTRSYDFSTRIIHAEGGAANTVDIENCAFDMTGNTNNRPIYIKSDGALVRLYNNLVYNLMSGEFFVHNESYPFVIDARYNRFYNFIPLGNGGGIFNTRQTGCRGIIANNTVWGATYLVSTDGNALGVTNVNNIVEYFKPNGNNQARWFCYDSTGRIVFADYNYVGDSNAVAFGGGVVKGPSNVTTLSEAQIAFANTNDVTHPDFLKITQQSIAASSAASITYPTLNLPAWAGWAAPLGAPTNPVLSVSPLVLDFGLSLTGLTCQIANAGSGTLAWTNTVMPGGTWLSVAPLSGAQSGNVTVSVNRTGLSYGSFTGRVAVTANGDVTAQYVTIYLTKAPPILVVTPMTLDAGATLTALPYALSNAGAEVLYWTNTVASGGAWLSITPLTGSQNGAATASVNRMSVGYGAYTGAVVVSANGTVPAATVSVFMTKSPPDLAVTPLALDFGRASTSQTVDVWNNGVGAVNWTAAPDAAWLATSASAGTASNAHQIVTVLVNRTLLAPSNDYAGHVLFTPDAGPVETVTVSVSTFPLVTNGVGYLRIAIVPDSNTNVPMPGRLILASVAADATNYIQWFLTEIESQTNRWGYTGWPLNTLLQGVHHPARYLTYRVPAGELLITAGRGMSWYPTNTQVTINAGTTTDVTMALGRVVAMEARGWYGGEAHLHVIHGGGDYPINLITSNQFMLWAESAGLNWLSLCQEFIGAGSTNLAAQQAYMLPMSNATCQVWMGGERPKSILGHLAAIIPSQNPYTVFDDPPYYIGCEQVRRQGGITYPVHADRQYGALPYEWNNFYKMYPLDALLGPSFDAWSVASNNEYGYNGRQMGWWYALLNRGGRLAAMADSDYSFEGMAGGMATIGNWMTYVNISGQVFSIQNICTAIREGRTFGTTGPLLFFSIDGAQPGDTLPIGTHTARIETYLPFNPWTLGNSVTAGATPMRIATVELVRNGVLLKSWTGLNAAATTLYWSVTETDTNAYYTVHVNSTEPHNMNAAVASPIYFSARPLRQKPLTTTIAGRVYDAYTGARKPATVAVKRYGDTLANVATTTDGFFKISMPLDADLMLRPFAADEAAGPLPAHRVIDHELVFSNITTMSRSVLGSDANNYASNAVLANGVIEKMVSIVSTMRWECPLKYQFKGSYVNTNLTGNFPISNVQIVSAPPAFPAYTNPVAVMLIVDKYEVAPGDTLNYAAIFRAEGNTNAAISSCYIKLACWRPDAPSSYNTWGLNAYEQNSGYMNLGGGFYAYLGAMTIPAFATNCYQGPGIVVDMYTRNPVNYAYPTRLALYMNVGTTKRGLLVTTSWPGIPFAWPNHLQNGLGPANLSQSTDGWNVPRQDYRPMKVRLNGYLDVCPTNDMDMCADADDAYFYDWPHYYTKGATPKDPVRAQPAVAFPDIATRAIDPFAAGFGSTAPTVVPVAPADDSYVPYGSTNNLVCDYLVLGKNVSNVQFAVTAPNATVVTTNLGHQFVLPYSATISGTYTWSATVLDAAGMRTTSAAYHFNNGTATTTRANAPIVVITDANFSVSNNVTHANIHGTNAFAVGQMWYESMTGIVVNDAGSFAVTNPWMITVNALIAGATNFVDVMATNASGDEAHDTIEIHRMLPAGSTPHPSDVLQFTAALAAGGNGQVVLAWSNGMINVLACTNRSYTADLSCWFELVSAVTSPWTHEDASNYPVIFYRIISGVYTSHYDVGKYTVTLAPGTGSDPANNWISPPLELFSNTVNYVLGQQLNYDDTYFDILKAQSFIGSDAQVDTYYFAGTWTDFDQESTRLATGHGYMLVVDANHTQPKTVAFIGKVPDAAVTNVISAPNGTDPVYNWIGAPSPALRGFFANGLTNPVVATETDANFDLYKHQVSIGADAQKDWYYLNGVWNDFEEGTPWQTPGMGGMLILDAIHTGAGTTWAAPKTR